MSQLTVPSRVVRTIVSLTLHVSLFTIVPRRVVVDSFVHSLHSSAWQYWPLDWVLCIESQVAQITKAEEMLTKDVLTIFRPEKPETAKEKQAAYFKHSEGSSGGSSSFAYLDAFDNPNADLEDAVHPWHNVVDGCRFFAKMLLQYLPSLSPLFLGAYFIGHYEGWTWDDCI